MEYNREDFEVENEDQEYLTSILINICSREFVLFSSDGSERKVDCDSVDAFMEVLDVVRALVDEEYIFYAEPEVIHNK